MENLVTEKFYEKVDKAVKDGMLNIAVVHDNLIEVIKNFDIALKEKNEYIERLKDVIRDYSERFCELKKEHREEIENYKNAIEEQQKDIELYKKSELCYDAAINTLKDEIEGLFNINLSLKRDLDELKSSTTFINADEENYRKFCEEFAQWECPKKPEVKVNDLNAEKAFKIVIDDNSKLDAVPDYVRIEKSDRVKWNPKMNINQVKAVDSTLVKQWFAGLLNQSFGQEYFNFDELENLVQDYFNNVYKTEEQMEREQEINIMKR